MAEQGSEELLREVVVVFRGHEVGAQADAELVGLLAAEGDHDEGLVGVESEQRGNGGDEVARVAEPDVGVGRRGHGTTIAVLADDAKPASPSLWTTRGEASADGSPIGRCG
nr:hypothetical protein GCM10020241_19620 [Streptoalloteichus tenebrarius]